jgi:hypothetical protein
MALDDKFMHGNFRCLRQVTTSTKYLTCLYFYKQPSVVYRKGKLLSLDTKGLSRYYLVNRNNILRLQKWA